MHRATPVRKLSGPNWRSFSRVGDLLSSYGPAGSLVSLGEARSVLSPRLLREVRERSAVLPCENALASWNGGCLKLAGDGGQGSDSVLRRSVSISGSEGGWMSGSGHWRLSGGENPGVPLGGQNLKV